MYRPVHTCTYLYILVHTMYILEIIFSLAMLRWSVEALKKVIAMLRNPEFDSKEVDPDLYKRLENVLGRVPLIPLFLAGNSTPTIPHKFSKHKGSAFPMGSADTANADGRRGSNVYEVNHWLWIFGRGKPRLGGVSVAETAVRKSARHEVKSAVETRWRRKAAKASSE
jgi:hypothetical protein